jgi:acyl-CoA reductase-like NAD-dependent aldehyde dehydrogenase
VRARAEPVAAPPTSVRVDERPQVIELLPDPERVLPMLIGGRPALASDGGTIDVLNPATGRTIAKVPAATRDDIQTAYDAADAAFPAWSKAHPTERARALRHLADLVDAHGDELAALDVMDNGSPIKEMRKDVDIASAQLRYFAGLTLQARGETIPTGDGRLNYTLRQPYGVIGRIVPFNHPLMFAAGKIAAPLAAGNTVIIKPSEHTSLSALRLAEIISEALPPGVVNIVTGWGHTAGDAMVAHPGIRRLAFIGADTTGRAIVQRAMSINVKHVSLELGGKNPLLVFADADLDLAVDGAIRGMNFTWQGQSCGSTSRVYVQRDIHDAFLDKLVTSVSSLKQGLPDDWTTETGSMINQQQFDKVQSYVKLGQEEGSRLVIGGEHVTDDGLQDGLFISPAVFADVDHDSRMAREEIFGPVMAVMPFDDYADGLQRANDTGLGLTASVYTRDIGVAHRFADDVEAGFVWVNDSSRHFLGAPFGGYKDSGIGREEDLEELLSYTQVKNVNVWYAP